MRYEPEHARIVPIGEPWTSTSSWRSWKRGRTKNPDEEHWELIEGVAVMMAPASYANRRIVWNLCALLNSAFAARHLDLFAYFDVGVRLPGVKNFQPQPDVVPGIAGYDFYSERFQPVAEVLRPRTGGRRSI